MAALLYVRVEGEEAVGDVKVQQEDSLADVVERAVEKERIEDIRLEGRGGVEAAGQSRRGFQGGCIGHLQ